MARKNVFGLDSDPSTPSDADIKIVNARPLVGLERPIKRASPVGAFSSSLGGMSEKANRADELEKQLASGHAVVEIDPVLIDSSFVIDRLGISNSDQESLVAQIRDHGQQVPILVRPSPNSPGRYQVAYGHRRLAAIKSLGGPVRAVIRELTDEQLVVSQGQENNARTDLTFIERSYFAYRLESRGFSREVIMAALGVDKAALSRMISLVDSLPGELIEAIGPAPGFGRMRWAELAELLQAKQKRLKALKEIQETAFLQLTSDQRFQSVYDLVRHMKVKARADVWVTASGIKAVRITETDERLSLSFDKGVDAGFGSFVESKLEELYADFLSSDKTRQAGE